jgi:hypothetical protein
VRKSSRRSAVVAVFMISGNITNRALRKRCSMRLLALCPALAAGQKTPPTHQTPPRFRRAATIRPIRRNPCRHAGAIGPRRHLLHPRNLTPSPHQHSPATHPPANSANASIALLPAFPLPAASHHPILSPTPCPTRNSTSHTTSSSKKASQTRPTPPPSSASISPQKSPHSSIGTNSSSSPALSSTN